MFIELDYDLQKTMYKENKKEKTKTKKKNCETRIRLIFTMILQRQKRSQMNKVHKKKL